jgi:uncharacterized FlaG/YvyC family protein
MSVSSVLLFSPSTDPQVEQGTVRPTQAASQANPGNDPSRENQSSQIHHSRSSTIQDEVKVQMEPPGEIAVYQFLDQSGSVILQVPPEQVLNLARQISQELSQEAALKAPAGIGKGEDNGH